MKDSGHKNKLSGSKKETRKIKLMSGVFIDNIIWVTCPFD